LGLSIVTLESRLEANAAIENARRRPQNRLSFSVGAARYDPKNPCTLTELLYRAERLMYENKRKKQSGLPSTAVEESHPDPRAPCPQRFGVSFGLVSPEDIGAEQQVRNPQLLPSLLPYLDFR